MQCTDVRTCVCAQACTHVSMILCIKLQHCNALQYTATHCNTMQYTATNCNTLQHTATHCNTLQHTATHCNTLQHTATHSMIPYILILLPEIHSTVHHTLRNYSHTSSSSPPYPPHPHSTAAATPSNKANLPVQTLQQGYQQHQLPHHQLQNLTFQQQHSDSPIDALVHNQIGRASCRERV